MCSIEKPKTAARTYLIASWLGFAPLLIAAAAMGNGFSPSNTQLRTVMRTVEKPALDATRIDLLRKQVAVLMAQKDRAEAALTDSQKKLKACRRLVSRYIEELAYVDELYAASQRGVK